MTIEALADTREFTDRRLKSGGLPTRHDAVGAVLLVVGTAGFLVYVNSLERDLWFWVHDFAWLTTFHDGELLHATKAHLSIVPGALTFAVTNVVGLEHGYDVMRSIALLALVGLAVAIWCHLRRRVDPIVAALTSLGLVWFTSNHADVLNPTLLKHVLPLLVAVVVAGRLERAHHAWRRDVFTTMLIAIAIGTSSTGVVVLAIVAVHLAGTDAPPTRWWLLLSPGAAWLVWFAIAGNPEAASGVQRAGTPTARELLQHTDDLVSTTFVDLGGGNPAIGFGLGVGFTAVLVLSLVRWHTCGRSSLRWIAAGATFIVLTASVQNQILLSIGEPARYRFILATFVLLAATESIRGLVVDRRIVGAATVLLVANGLVLIDGLQGHHSFIRGALASDAPLLLGAEAAGSRADPDRVISDPVADLTTVGAYLELVDHVGSPRNLLASVPFSSGAATEADQILLDDVPIEVSPGTCTSTNVSGASLTIAPGSTVAFTAIGTSARVFVVRFGEFRFGLEPVATVDDRKSVLLSFADDEIPVQWKIRGSSGAVLTLC